MNFIFKKKNANSPKDLINFLIINLHEELNKTKEINNNNNNNDMNNQLDERDQKRMLEYFGNNIFMKENKSIISDIFFGIRETIIKCDKCQNSNYNYQIYYFLDFSLESIFKFINENNSQRLLQNQIYNNIGFSINQNFINIQNNNNNNIINIYNCFEYAQRINKPNFNNNIYCNTCKIKCPFFYQINLSILPKILIIFINRNEKIKTNIKFVFYEYLNLVNYISFKNTGFNYKLLGIVSSMKDNETEKHFIAYCRNIIDSKWYKYNDIIVSQVNNFKEEVIENSTPYILFYQKLND